MTTRTLPADLFPDLDLWKPDLPVKQNGNGFLVLDPLRRKWIRLSPEEWVRQHVIFWLLQHTRFPVSLLSIERKVHFSSGNRADLVGYGNNARPLLLVECKAPYENVSPVTAMQAMKYNQHLFAPYLWLTNGRKHIVLHMEKAGTTPVELEMLPPFPEMVRKHA